MRRSTPLIAVAFVLLVFTARVSTQTGANNRFAAGDVLVKFKPGVSAAAQADTHRAAGGTVVAQIARTGLERVAVGRGGEAAAIDRYRANPNVEYAEPNFVRTVPTPTSHTPGTEVVPGDYYFDEQWGLNNTGQLFYCIPYVGGDLCFYVGTPDADIDAPEGWAISTGSPAVPVAVIDTGVDYTHPDLAPNYAGGYDFVNSDADPMDDHGHGTHVSGIIAAALNNLTGSPAKEEGVVGVAPNARILAYKVCAADGTCTDFAIAQALARAVTDSAKVINMSLGSTDFSQSLHDAVEDAWNAGLVVVAGAGNDGNSELFYPAAYDNVVSVGAFDEDHLRASFSNYGSWVDISAPGNVIMSTYPMSTCTPTATPGDTGCYTWLSGTSMATPFVSGAAALMWSRSDVTSNSQVVDILLNSADPKGASTVPLNSWTIHGGLNIHNALSYGATNLPPTANAGPDQTVADSDGDGVAAVTLDGSGSSDPDGQIVGYEWSENSSVVAVGVAPSVSLAVGIHTLTLRVTDDAGNSASDTVTITVNAAPPPPTALTVTGISPNIVSQNVGTVAFVITGTGFVNGATVAFLDGSGPAPRVRSVRFDSSTQLTATVEIRSGGSQKIRRWDVRVTNPDGSSATGAGLLTITK